MDLKEFDPELMGEQTPVEGGLYNRDHHFRAVYGDDHVYLKEVDSGPLELGEQREGLSMDEVYSNLAAEIVLDDLDVNVPEMLYDEENELLVIEEVGIDAHPVSDVDQAELYLPEFDLDRYVDAVVGRLLVGDDDIRANILVDATGEFYAIDFDRAAERRMQFHDHTYGELVGTVRYWAENDLNRQADREMVRKRSERLVDQLDVEETKEELENLPEFRGKETMLQNLDWFQETFAE